MNGGEVDVFVEDEIFYRSVDFRPLARGEEKFFDTNEITVEISVVARNKKL